MCAKFPDTINSDSRFNYFIYHFCAFFIALGFFDHSTAKFQFVNAVDWLPFLNMHFYIGIDGISLFFILLTTFLVPFCLLVGWDSVQKM